MRQTVQHQHLTSQHLLTSAAARSRWKTWSSPVRIPDSRGDSGPVQHQSSTNLLDQTSTSLLDQTWTAQQVHKQARLVSVLLTEVVQTFPASSRFPQTAVDVSSCCSTRP